MIHSETSLVVQLLRLSSSAGRVGSIPGQIANALWPKTQNIKQKQYCNKFNKDFKKLHIKKKKKRDTQRTQRKQIGGCQLVGAGGQTKRVKVTKRHQNPVIK